MVISNGVVDPSIFGTDEPQDNGGIPAFLDRRAHEPVPAHTGSDDAHGVEEDAPGLSSEGDGSQLADHDDNNASGADAVHVVDDGDVVWEDVPVHTDSGSGELGGNLDVQAAAGFAPEVVGHASEVNETAIPEHTPLGHNAPPPEPLTREQMLKDFNRDVAAYGKDSGKGAAALPRLGMRVIRAAYDGLISNEKPKTGEKSDAVRIYEAYASNDSKHAEHTKGGMKANAAKLNALIGLGCMTTVDGVEVASRAIAIREKLEAADAKPKALFAGLVDVARAQLGQDTALSDAAIEAAFGKVEKEKTLAGEWESVLKKVEGLISGENNHNLKDTTDRAEIIYGQIKEHVNAFGMDKQREQDVAWLMEKGLTREAAIEIASK
jgi:hypothetical protein